MSAEIPTLANARPVKPILVRHIVGAAPRPAHYAYHQAFPTAKGARTGTLSVLKNRALKDHKANYVPGVSIAIRSQQPTDSIQYTMKLGAEAAGVPDLDAYAEQVGGDGYEAGIPKAQKRLRKIGRETAEKMELMMNGREKSLDVALYDGTGFNSGSAALVGAESWLNVNADIPSHLQQARKDLAEDSGLTLMMTRDVWLSFQSNLALREGLPITERRQVLTEQTSLQLLGDYGIERVVVSRAAYTRGGSDYIMRSAAYIYVGTEIDEVIGEGEAVNPSAFWRLCEDLRPEGRLEAGTRINFGDAAKRMWDFYVRQGYDNNTMQEVVQILYGEVFVPCRKDKLLRLKM